MYERELYLAVGRRDPWWARGCAPGIARHDRRLADLICRCACAEQTSYRAERGRYGPVQAGAKLVECGRLALRLHEMEPDRANGAWRRHLVLNVISFSRPHGGRCIPARLSLGASRVRSVIRVGADSNPAAPAAAGLLHAHEEHRAPGSAPAHPDDVEPRGRFERPRAKQHWIATHPGGGSGRVAQAEPVCARAAGE